MKEQGIIEKRTFSMCLGKNGGYFQMGGYDKTGHLDDEANSDVTWMWMKQMNADFKVTMRGIKMNNCLMANSNH